MRMESRHRERRGFTLTEMLVVIGVIALLAAMLFPIIGSVNRSRREKECISHLNAIVSALNLYKENYGRYPEALYGANSEPRLYGRDYIADEDTFLCPSAPVRGSSRNWVQAVNPTTGVLTPHTLMEFSAYDFQYRPGRTTGVRELHYSPKWTAGPPRPGDDPRQLIRRDPPGDTVVTWCLYHCDMDTNGNPTGGMALVAFLNGRVERIPASRLVTWTGPTYPWQVKP